MQKFENGTPYVIIRERKVNFSLLFSVKGFLRDCPSGKLDKKKFIDVYKQFYPQGKADSFCKSVERSRVLSNLFSVSIRYAFATFDANNDGTIDFDEFILAIAATSQGDVDDRLEVAFEM